MRINREEREFIIYELKNYKRYKDELSLLREQILESSPHPPDGMPRGNATSDSTAVKVLALNKKTTGILAMERITHAVDNALASLPELHRNVFEQVYLKRRDVTYALCDEIHTSMSTLYRAMERIIQATGEELGICV